MNSHKDLNELIDYFKEINEESDQEFVNSNDDDNINKTFLGEKKN